MLRFLFLNCLFWGVLAFLSPWLSPEVTWLAAFLAFSIPVWLLAISGFILFYAAKRRWLVVAYSLLILVLGGGLHLRASFGGGAGKGSPELRVVSQNVRYFRQDDGTPMPANARALEEFLQDREADIVCLQEFTNLNRAVVARLRRQFPYAHFFVQRGTLDGFGIATFSRFPILLAREVSFNDSPVNAALITDLQLPSGDTLRVCNLHLHSFGLHQSKDLKEVISRLKKGVSLQARQLKKLLAQVENKKTFATLFCGDFNATPYSYVYRYMSRNYQNSFENSGSGIGTTYRGNIPFLRIDHQFFTKNLHNFRTEVAQEAVYSDHYPLISDYRLVK